MMENRQTVDFDIHGKVGVRLIGARSCDIAAVARQLGPLQKPLDRDPDIVIRFVDSLNVKNLRRIALHAGYTDTDFYILRSSKRPAKVKMPFDAIGGTCEIVCESGLQSVPLLIHIVNVTMLRYDCVAVHASAFTYKNLGIVVMGWAKGGKSESLLAFTRHNATYLGDEWIYLSQDGQKMYGIPENMRLWEWHLRERPELMRLVPRETRWLFRGLAALERLQRASEKSLLRRFFLFKLLREAMPALNRQRNVVLPPAEIFAQRFGPLSGRPDRVFFVTSHDEAEIRIRNLDPGEIAKRMLASIRHEQLPLWEMYLAYCFAFPDRRNTFLEHVQDRQFEILRRALNGKQVFEVHHPYPCSLEALYHSMRPYCRPENDGADAAKEEEQAATSPAECTAEKIPVY